MNIKTFTFNPYYENTYLIWDKNKLGAIIDPGCYFEEEKEELRSFIETEKIEIKLLLNTHCHLDHVFGNSFVHKTYGTLPHIHKLDLPVYKAVPNYSGGMGFEVKDLPEAITDLEEGKNVELGDLSLQVLFTPGHSPGSVCFYHEESKNLIGGDVLFQRSIGRTDLPGGNTQDLLNSIREKLFVLPDEVLVYPGHGPITDIGSEKKFNPFLQ